MKQSERLTAKFKQLNVWVIIALTILLIIASLAFPGLLSSKYLSERVLLRFVNTLGYITIFSLYLMGIIVVVNYIYYALLKLNRANFYDPTQRTLLIGVLKDPAVQGNIEAFREKSKALVSDYANYLSEIIGSILPNALKQPFMLEQYFRAKVENIQNSYSDGINTINLLSNVAPVVGFFGTLLGLIQAFAASANAMQTEGQMTPETFAALQNSIMIAIITSLFGVSLKILGSILRHHLIAKMNMIGDEIHQIPVEVLYGE